MPPFVGPIPTGVAKSVGSHLCRLAADFGQAALAIMKRGGTIVNNLSIAANRVFAGSAAYNASKHAALGLTNTLREELRPKGIRVVGLLPGATDTAIWNTLWPEAPR